MRTKFTRESILSYTGCYSKDKAETVLGDKLEFTISEILDFDIPLKDKIWFICKRCEFTVIEFRELAIGCAECVLPIYEAKYQDNKAPREAIQAARDYLNGVIDLEVLESKRYAASRGATHAATYAAYYAAAASAANDASSAASASASAANAAYAAYASYSTGDAYDTYANATDITDATDTVILKYVKDFTSKP